MAQLKIPHSFKFSEQVTKALDLLAKLPAYGSKTRVIEALVWEKAVELCLAKSVGCNNRNNRSGNSKRTAR